jgi:hypothetical protein
VEQQATASRAKHRMQLIVAPQDCCCAIVAFPVEHVIHILVMGKPEVFTAAALGTLLLLVRVASAEQSLTFALSGTCPTRDAVIAAIEDASTRIEIVASEVVAAASLIVSDEGSSYRVQVGRDTKTFIDAPRDCAERALKVAVLAVLGLERPLVVEAETPRTRTSVHEPGRRVRPVSFGVQVEVGGVIERALYAENSVGSTGADVRVAFGHFNLSLIVGVAMLTQVVLDNPLRFMFSTGDTADTATPHALIQVDRTPIDLALRGRLGNESVTAMLEAGPRFTVQRSNAALVRGAEAPMRVFSAFELEPGARLAARFELWPSASYGVYFGSHGEYIHRPSRFTFPHIRGLQEVGRMPSFWGGFSFGIGIRMR